MYKEWLKEFDSKALHGTTTVGLVTQDAVILAADKRATAGTFIAHRQTKKIILVDSRLAITTAGLVADAQVLADYLSNQIRYYTMVSKHPFTVKAAASFLSAVLYSYKFFPFIVQLLVGGYDTAPRLYSLDWFGSVLEEKYTATGSGSPIALGVIEDGYREDLSIEEARQLAVRAVRMALRRDSATGDGIDSVVITKDGAKLFFDPP